MKVIICENYDEMSQKAADIFAAQLTLKEDTILGLATGSTPIGMYKALTAKCQDKKISFANATSYNLDEYLGLDGTHSQSYRYFMNENFFNHIDIDKNNTYVPSGKAEDVAAEGARYDAQIEAAGGIDIQVLGIGGNGHIAFNEPSDHFELGTHRVTLTNETIEANSRFFESKSDVPTEAITMGVGAIMRAKKIVLLASGASKADAVYATVHGKITPEIPASILQLHQDITIIVDKDAAAKL